jgi:peptidoglycan hydrolase-like protein with peptidoglycan-binding domain
MTGRARRASLIVGAGVLVAAGAIAALGVSALGPGGWSRAGEPEPRPTKQLSTATVTRQTLTREGFAQGLLGYGPVSPLSSKASGTVTRLAPLGSVVHRGEELLRVDERPVVLMYGSIPMFRSLGERTKGADIEQFERNLAALGYGGFTVDEEYTALTKAAVRRWQRDLGLPASGTVHPGLVVYAPRAVRIAEHLTRVGADATGNVLGTSGTTRTVTVSVRPGDSGWAERGARVRVTLPDGTEIGGTVRRRGTATTARSPVGGGSAPDDELAAGPGEEGGGEPSVPVTIAVGRQRTLDAFDRATVDVQYVEERRRNVLTVPVTALLALAEGGYGVEIVIAPGASRIVAVRAGMFTLGQVEVSGEGIAEGVKVVVPS